MSGTFYEREGREAYAAGKSRSSTNYRGNMGAEWRRGYDAAKAEQAAMEAR